MNKSTLYECLLSKNSTNLKQCLNSLRKHDNFHEIAQIEVNSVKPIVLMRTLEKYGLNLAEENGQLKVSQL